MGLSQPCDGGFSSTDLFVNLIKFVSQCDGRFAISIPLLSERHSPTMRDSGTSGFLRIPDESGDCNLFSNSFYQRRSPFTRGSPHTLPRRSICVSGVVCIYPVPDCRFLKSTLK